MQDKPALWSTALMWLVAELFEALPEAGDLPQPKLVVFLDEAHLLFADATDAFLDALERTVRLIRSKGVGVFFVTQQPTDLSDAVLAQLGLRIQHALRAFTPNDAKALRATVSTYPRSDLYDVETLLTSVGIGEAAVTLLSEKGVPDAGRAHAPARARLADGAGRRRRGAPRRRRRCGRSTASPSTRRAPASCSPGGSRAPAAGAEGRAGARPARADGARPGAARRRAPAPRGTGADAIGDFLRSRQGKACRSKVTRGILGMLRKRI